MSGIITKAQLDGVWEYTCEIKTPGHFFPDEFIANDSRHKVNVHQGIIDFKMIDDNHIEIKGKRTGRKSKIGSNLVEDKLKEKIDKFSQAYCSLLSANRLVYRYKVENVDIIGSTLVELIEENFMKGMFHYSLSDETINNISIKDDNWHRTLKRDMEWLPIVGEISLTKKSKK